MGFIPFHFIDLLDILLVAGILFFVYKAMKGTNAPYIMGGIVMVYLVWIVVKALNMELLSTILGQIISVGVIALLVIFQPELRRFLFTLGISQKRWNFLNRLLSIQRKHDHVSISPIVSACHDMSEEKVGALIVFQRGDDLQFVIDGGIALDAKVSTSLIKNIFFKNAPLHDGAVIISNNRIIAAKCILPVTQSSVPKSYGTRHRAGIGVTEVANVISLIVSEETGIISIVKQGNVTRYADYDMLVEALKDYYWQDMALSNKRGGGSRS